MSPNEKQMRIQRIRVGLTGLAGVFVVAAAATAIFANASDEPKVTPGAHPTEAASAAQDMVSGNSSKLATEPLAEIGVAPGAADAAKAAEATNSDSKLTPPANAPSH